MSKFKKKKKNNITEYFLNIFDDGSVKATKDFAYFQAKKIQKVDEETYKLARRLL